MSEINQALIEGRNNIDEQGGIVLYAIKLSLDLINDHQYIVELEMEEDRFVDSLFKFYEQMPHDQIIDSFSIMLVCLIDVTTDSQRLEMKQEKYFNSLVHLLDSDDEDVLVGVTLFMDLFVVVLKENGEICQKDEFLQVMEKNGGLDSLVKIFNDDKYKTSDVKKYSAIVIGSLHKAVKLPDEYRVALIEYLKSLSDDKDGEIAYLSVLVLARLAECKENNADIMSGNIESVIRKCIQEGEERASDYAMLLSLNLLYYGTDDVKNCIKSMLPWGEIREFTNFMFEDEDEKDNVFLTAKLLDEWIQFLA